MTNRYSGSLKASRHTPEEVLEQKQVAENERYQEWQSLGGDNLDAVYDEAMKVRLADDYDSMRASIMTGEANTHTNGRANNRGRQAFYLAHNIRQARQELAGLDRGSEQWIQQVSDREDRLQDLLARDDSDLNEAEMNFIIDLSGGRYDSVLGGQTSGETSASVGAGKSSEAENRPFNLAEAASDPNIDDATRRALIDINNLLTVKPQLAIEGAKPNISAGGSQVEQEAQRLVDEINRSSLTPEQRAAVQGMVDGIITDIDRPLHGNETPEDSDDSQVPVPTGPLEGDQAVREGESLEEYEARISSNVVPIEKIDAGEDDSVDSPEVKGPISSIQQAIDALGKRQSELDPESDEYKKMDNQINALIASRDIMNAESAGGEGRQPVPIDKIDVDDNEEEEAEGSESRGDGSVLESDANAEGIVGIRGRWLEYMLNEHSQDMKEREQARQEFLKIMAKSQKGHLRRIKPDGFVAKSLRSLFAGVNGNKLADFLTKPTNEEKAAGDRYAEALAKIDSARHNFMGHEHDNGNMSLEELKAERALFMTTEHANNSRAIAELQKASSGKPMNKWLRRAGYVGAGVAGGLLALTPLGWVAGVAAAGTGAAALRIGANKRNANLEGPNVTGGGKYVVDGVAANYQREFAKKFTNGDETEGGREMAAADLVNTHYDETSNEVGKNRNRIVGPAILAGLTAAATKLGIDGITDNFPKDVPSESTPDPKPEDPTIIVDPPRGEPPEVSPGIELVDVNTNGAPERAVDELLHNTGYEISGDKTSFLSSLAERLGGEDKMFVDGSGNPVDMYLGGEGDPRYQPWDSNIGIRLSDEAVRLLGEMSGVSKIS